MAPCRDKVRQPVLGVYPQPHRRKEKVVVVDDVLSNIVVDLRLVPEFLAVPSAIGHELGVEVIDEAQFKALIMNS